MSITETIANKVVEGMYNGNFKDWYNLNGKHYLPLGDFGGIEKQRNKTYFMNNVDNNIYLISSISFATLDDEHYFLRMKIEGNELYIPIM